MKQTISVLLHDRFNDAERIIGMFSGTGYKIEKMLLLKQGDTNLSQLVLVTETTGKNVENLLTRLRQQVRVSSAEAVEGDSIDDEMFRARSLGSSSDPRKSINGEIN